MPALALALPYFQEFFGSGGALPANVVTTSSLAVTSGGNNVTSG